MALWAIQFIQFQAHPYAPGALPHSCPHALCAMPPHTPWAPTLPPRRSARCLRGPPDAPQRSRRTVSIMPSVPCWLTHQGHAPFFPPHRSARCWRRASGASPPLRSTTSCWGSWRSGRAGRRLRGQRTGARGTGRTNYCVPVRRPACAPCFCLLLLRSGRAGRRPHRPDIFVAVD